ncbi:hypothetical protein ACL02R_15675 [Streptomyces sp. MS19]|uniref:hypothetical protein n=1 Tax=Streptomyces sp. MS19 TaxID=3385972 RepID=UPI00399F55FD
MYGPPTAPPPPGRDVRAEALRWIFAAVPLLSLGLLAWVPFIHLASRRGRRSDWRYAALYGALSVGEVILLVTIPDGDDGNAGVFGGAYVIALILGACCHAAVTGHLPRHTPHAPQQTPLPGPYGTHHPAPPPTPTPATPTYPRMHQVASELDELGEYLRRQEGR